MLHLQRFSTVDCNEHCRTSPAPEKPFHYSSYCSIQEVADQDWWSLIGPACNIRQLHFYSENIDEIPIIQGKFSEGKTEGGHISWRWRQCEFHWKRIDLTTWKLKIDRDKDEEWESGTVKSLLWSETVPTRSWASNNIEQKMWMNKTAVGESHFSWLEQP